MVKFSLASGTLHVIYNGVEVSCFIKWHLIFFENPKSNLKLLVLILGIFVMFVENVTYVFLSTMLSWSCVNSKPIFSLTIEGYFIYIG